MSLLLALRTDTSKAEIYLLDQFGNRVVQYSWEAARELSKTLLSTIQKILKQNNKTIDDVSGIIVFQGPGSFTGLRIGVTVANTIAYSQKKPIVGVQTELWQKNGIERLQNGEYDKIVVPFYGADAHITQPRK